ncbi:BamA/OMP85 family outer membrane protein [Allomeiothermus silvanus]|uniref:BamA/OMP85 family outer membrane protein n=1 Tax=Allomeiothermus silvanus TaxID=52022 RepID=UPI0023F31AF9|nr:POTRA domain-containing protein [Allomeiothermus silvanus]
MKRALALVFVVVSLALAAPIQDLEIRGGDPVLQALARIALPFGVGDEPGDLEAARKAVLDSGFFREVKVSLEGNKLVVELTPNPPINTIAIDSKALPQNVAQQFLLNEFALGPGATYNPKRANEAAQGLSQYYRQQGFPFSPVVTVEVSTVAQGLNLTFKVQENPELKKVELDNPTFVPKERLEPIVQAIAQGGRFDFERYRSAFEQIAQIYAQAGFRGSGVDVSSTVLEDGILKVRLRELKVAEIQANGLDVANLGLKPGDPFNYDRLLDGINALTKATGRQIGFRAESVGNDQVRLILEPGEQTYGPIREVRIVGATAIPEARLRAALRLKPGDIFNPALANEDFGRLLNLYRSEGYEIVAQPKITFENGVYTQTLTEVKIGGYKLNWSGPHRTQDEVILRELPKPGTLFSARAFLNGLSNVLRTGVLAEPPSRTVEPGEKPDEIIIVLGLKEGRTGAFVPSIGWSSLEGWSGSVSYSEGNLWGLNHKLSAELSFGFNESGDNFSLSLGYQIPWLYLDFADFKEVRTATSFSIFTRPVPNFDLYDPSGNKTGWQYTQRSTGFEFGLSRPLSADLPNLRLGTSLRYEYKSPSLEIYDPNRPCVNDPKNTQKPQCSDPNYTGVTEDQARALLSSPSNNLSLGLSATYSNADNPGFPTQGFGASAQTSYVLTLPRSGNGSQYIPFSITGKTYWGLDQAKRQALALRVSTGTILGVAGTIPNESLYGVGGTLDEALTLRGYDPRFQTGRYFFTSSLEYRYDFRFSENGGTNIIGVAFTDLGTAWGSTANPQPQLHMGFGLGIQLDLDLFGALLPSIRFDYGVGFVEGRAEGKFHFRLGPLF